MNFRLERQIFGDKFTLGELFCEDMHFSYTCEDKDRYLENGNEKIYGQTAIPRGKYRLAITFSPHFKRNVVEIQNVPGFTKVYFHGGNNADDSLGCVLHGRVRTNNGCANCSEVVARLEAMVDKAEDEMEEMWLTIL